MKKQGRPRVKKLDYKEVGSHRISTRNKREIKKRYGSIQKFIDHAIDTLLWKKN